MDDVAIQTAPEDRLRLDNGVRLAYQRFGQGPDVVLVHGWPLHSATWRGIVPALSQHFTCHLIDLPGSGSSPRGTGTEVTLSANCRVLRQAIDALKLDRYAFIAHDSGGIYPRYIAADDSGRVAALVLGNTDIPGHRPALLQQFIWLLKTPGGESALSLMLRSSAVRRSSMLGASVFYDARLANAAFYRLFLAPLLDDKRRLGSMMALVRDWEWPVVDGLAEAHASIQAPVQFIWGADDPIFPLRKAARMAAQFPADVELRVIERAKLFVHEEHPAVFAEHAVRFLKRCFSLTH